MPTPSIRHKLIQLIHNVHRAVRFVWASSPRWTIASIVLLLLRAALPIASLYLLKVMLDTITVALASPRPQEAFLQVLAVIALTGGVTWLSNVFQSIGNLVIQMQGNVVADHMYSILHAKSIEMDLAYYEDGRYYDTLHRAQQEAAYRPTQIVTGLTYVGQSALSLVLIGGLLISFHWSIGLVLMLAVLPNVLVRLRFSQKFYQFEREHTSMNRRSWYFNWMLTNQEHAKEVRIFDLGSTFRTRFQDLRQQIRESRFKLDQQRSAWDILATTIGTAAIYGSYALIAYMTVSGTFTLGALVVYYQAFQRGQAVLQELLGGLAGLYENTLFLNNLYEFLDLESHVPEPEHPLPVPRPMRQGIVFENVSFQYPRSDHPALENVNLVIRPGEVIALVGENGSGKTTLVKLLCRLYDPAAGRITLDGIDLPAFATCDLRRSIGIIFQDYARYNLSARENIGFGDAEVAAGSSMSDEIVQAARHSGAHEVIESLPRGYDTTLGRFLEDGEELSVGQWQKIALARAFIRNSQLIVLDEPTSALDPKAEYEVFEKFRTLLEGRSAILISHRLSTVKMADCIYVLKEGRIVESGTHDALMASDGFYAELFDIQAQYYR